MGSLVLVVRLVLADVRRYPSQVAMLLFAVTTATATLALGLSLGGSSRTLYEQTRAATAGPDVVALSGDTGPAVTSALAELADAPEVVAHHGPYRIVYASLTTRDATASPVVVHGFAEKSGALNRPLVTSGQWVRSGGTVLERGFATALGAGVGDRVTIAGRSYPVVGIAVTAATSVYPWAAQIGPGGGPADYTGLAWMTRSDARSLASSHDLPVTTAMDLKLRDPAATEAFTDAHPGSDVRITFHSWQRKAEQDAVILRGTQPILVLGSWLLSFLAVTGVAALAAGRAVQQTRRAGLLKAVGATPGLIAAVLLTEYLAVALLADVLGLVIARLTVPGIASPTASRIGDVGGPTGPVIAATTVLAVAVAVLSALRPTLRALRTTTVAALADTDHRARRRPWLTTLSALLPTPFLLGLRLTARRPGRVVLQACSTATTLIALTGLLSLPVQPSRGYGLNGSTVLPNLRAENSGHLLIAVAALLIAQLLPCLPGAVIGVPLGIGVFSALSPRNAILAPVSWMLLAALATLLVTVPLTALPAHLAARRPVVPVLCADTA
ncbi:ABC transporter permease [Nonomuraea zeae]|uniref:FtsX-like permease family protein n=1 Tax=Nonomuraea zeae TaxID=1642303 RepID=A0A5S4GKE1_9ACTN|nr:ABC transporter permease [Nonomuraea zeae]TMR33004.1 FtsX-like permease family protein [Nonomuraea zeae]